MLVVLPAPLTPATMITVGLAWPSAPPMTSGRCSGASSSAMASASSAFTAAGSVALASLTRRFRSSSRHCVAGTPVSAISSADSRSSYSASSMRVPVKTWAMLAPVLRRPCARRSSQPLRGSAAGAAVGGRRRPASARPAGPVPVRPRGSGPACQRPRPRGGRRRGGGLRARRRLLLEKTEHRIPGLAAGLRGAGTARYNRGLRRFSSAG